MLYLIVFLATTVVADRCCMHNQWEGTEESVVAALRPGTMDPIVTLASYYVSVDATKMINAAYGYNIVNGKHYNVTTIQDFKHGLHYVLTDGHCIKTPAGAYSGNCVPAEGVLTKTGFYGVGDKSLSISTYSMQIDGMTATVTVNDDCVFTNQVFYGEKDNQKIMSTTTFSNITLGVKDPSVFDIPKECQNAPLITPVIPKHPGQKLNKSTA